MNAKNSPVRTTAVTPIADDALRAVSGGGSLLVTKSTDRSSPGLYASCAKGSHIPKVTVIS